MFHTRHQCVATPARLLGPPCLVLALMLLGCNSAAVEPESGLLQGAPDDNSVSVEGLSGAIAIGSTVRTTADVNFRSGPSTSYSVVRVLPEGTELTTVDQKTATNKFYAVKSLGSKGWVHGAYLELVSGPEDDDSGPTNTARSAAIERAKQGVGFSYWWGHGRWRPEGVTSSTAGECEGSCPSCSHYGSYGADCSGFVAKVWQVPSSNDDLTIDSHPYSTASFADDTSQWYEVSRSSLELADALVYNNGSSGHILLYEAGDGWGSLWAYECRGCSAGCVYNLRSISSAYHGVRNSSF